MLLMPCLSLALRNTDSLTMGIHYLQPTAKRGANIDARPPSPYIAYLPCKLGGFQHYSRRAFTVVVPE